MPRRESTPFTQQALVLWLQKCSSRCKDAVELHCSTDGDETLELTRGVDGIAADGQPDCQVRRALERVGLIGQARALETHLAAGRFNRDDSKGIGVKLI